MSGHVVYRGPSALDGAPIVAALTMSSANRKTGDLAQLWILADHGESPSAAQRSGADRAICGDCPFRPARGGGCYVVTAQGPRAVWASTRAKDADLWSALAALRAKARRHPLWKAILRIGAYGDPAAVPVRYLEPLVRAVDGRATGYTHQWRRADVALSGMVMASVESERDAMLARRKGYRTFRTMAPGAPVAGAQEIVCPADSIGLTCAECGLCEGRRQGARSIAIEVHGYAVRKAMESTS